MEIEGQISHESMGELFDTKERFLIPAYQRRYSWEEEQVEDLWKDLQNLKNKGSDQHFFGTIVFKTRSGAHGTSKYDIVDGQQRITSVSILLCAIRDHLEEYHPDADGVNNRLETIEESLWIVNRDGDRVGLRLSLGNLDEDAYESLIEGHHGGIEAENEQLWHAYKLFRGSLDELDSLDEVKRLHDDLMDNLIHVSITVKEHSDAYKLFESMNNRGLGLSPVDLMKNYLLMEASNRDHVNDAYIEDCWGDVIRNLDAVTVRNPGIRFFRSYFMASREYGTNQKVTKGELYQPIFQDTIDQTDDLEAFMADVKTKSELYRDLIEGQIDMFDSSYNIEINNLLEDARIVSVTPFTLFLRAFTEYKDHDALNPNTLQLVIENCITLLVRRQICDRSTGPHDMIFNHLAQNIFDEGDPIDAILQYLRDEDYIPSDEQFRRHFKSETFRNNDHTKYILSKIEEDYFGEGGKRVSQSRHEVHIEHILPSYPGKHLTEKWLNPYDISDDEHADFKKTIGNLTLLEEDPNISASNRTLEKKQEYYTSESTDFNMTHELVENSSWTIDDIKQRSERLADIAVDVWSLQAT